MTKPIIIAVDAMGGDDAPQKVLDGIELHHNKTENIFYNILKKNQNVGEIKIIYQRTNHCFLYF